MCRNSIRYDVHLTNGDSIFISTGKDLRKLPKSIAKRELQNALRARHGFLADDLTVQNFIWIGPT